MRAGRKWECSRIFGEIHDGGGLESRSYLSDRQLLVHLGGLDPA
jgi:hypothetical protein